MAENKIENIIRMRYSCRSYKEARLSDKDRSELGAFVSQKITGPFGTNARFTLFAAEPLDSTALKGLGTYGFIRNPAAFVAGVALASLLTGCDALFGERVLEGRACDDGGK